jgi:hypothetical protein
MTKLPPEELVGDHKFSFAAEPADLSQARVGSVTFLDAFIFHVPGGQGAFKFRHRTQGKFRIGFTSTADRQAAVENLPTLFDPSVEIPEKWRVKK